MSRYSDSSLMSGLSSRRRMPRRRRVGRGILSELIGSVGLGRRHRRRRVGARRVVHRRRHGRGILDVLKSVASVALPFIKKSGIASHLAGMIPGVGGVASAGLRSLGYGRRHRVHRRRHHIGGVHSIMAMMRKHHVGARRRVHHRRHGRGILL